MSSAATSTTTAAVSSSKRLAIIGAGNLGLAITVGLLKGLFCFVV
jgi:hypothetical protein